MFVRRICPRLLLPVFVHTTVGNFIKMIGYLLKIRIRAIFLCIVVEFAVAPQRSFQSLPQRKIRNSVNFVFFFVIICRGQTRGSP